MHIFEVGYRQQDSPRAVEDDTRAHTVSQFIPRIRLGRSDLSTLISEVWEHFTYNYFNGHLCSGFTMWRLPSILHVHLYLQLALEAPYILYTVLTYQTHLWRLLQRLSLATGKGLNCIPLIYKPVQTIQQRYIYRLPSVRPHNYQNAVMLPDVTLTNVSY